MLNYRDILINGVALDRRTKLNFVGVSGVDNSGEARTDVTFDAIGTSVLTSDLPPGVDGQILVASGRDAIGDGGGGLLVFDEASSATPDNATVWQVDALPGRWERVYDGTHYNVRWFGAHPDATASANATAIQAAIDAAVAADVRVVLIPSGIYQISRTIYLGASASFSCLELRGDGYAYGGDYGGTALVATFSNAPAVNVQAARGSVVRDMALVGPNVDHVSSNSLGNANPLLDDTNIANWWDPTLSANGATRYAPSCGIAIDGWSGSAPATAYPTTHISYGKSFSTDVMIDNCQIIGFNTAIVNQPCDADGNADFTVVRRCSISYCVYAISVGNSQSRQFGIQDVKVGQCYTVLTNITHGARFGKFNGTVDNLSVGFCIQLFDFGTSAYFGPIKFSCCYAESVWRLGNYAANSASEQGVTFDNCQFGFHLQNTTRGIPATILSGSSQQTLLRFSGCTFGNYPSVIPIDQQGVVLDNCLCASVNRLENGVTKTYEALFHNATCDGVIIGIGNGTEDHRIKFDQLNIDTLADAGSVIARRGFSKSDRKRCIPIHTHVVSAIDDTLDDVHVRRQYTAWDKSGFSSCTLVHGSSSSSANTGVLTIVLSAATAAEAEHFGYAAGDIIVDGATKSVFAIRSFNDGTNTIVAELQNNYKVSGGNYTTVTAFSETVGVMYAYNARLFCPQYTLIADVTSGSAVLAATGRDDGYSGFISSGGVTDAVNVDDRAYVAPTVDAWITYGANKVTAIDADGTSITLDGTAPRNASRKRLGIWIRKPPANEASR
jgi:hypothetical protein